VEREIRCDRRRAYALVTPCRDEGAFLRTTIDTVAGQTVPPSRWVIVDDGSRDETPAILAEAARRHPFIEVVRRDDRGERAVGPGVIDAFYAGLERLDLDDYEYVCKLDGDLELPPRYFEQLLEKFETDPWLGNASGKAYLRYGDKLVHERRGDENAVGPSKFYRVSCFRDIGGFVRHAGWDGIDGHRCRMEGWVARSFDEPGLRFVHLRRTGSSQRSFWTGRVRWGRGKWYMGSAWWYILAVAIYRMAERPWVISGVGILWGWILAALTRQPRYGDRAFRRFFRRYELISLLRGKRWTMARLHDRIRCTVPRASRGPDPVAADTTPGRLERPARATAA
jgi:glycosyltransferase involved in cell wall biosynthesis